MAGSEHELALDDNPSHEIAESAADAIPGRDCMGAIDPDLQHSDHRKAYDELEAHYIQ